MSNDGDFFGGGSVARARNRWGYKNPFLFPPRTFNAKNINDRTRSFWVPLGSGSAKSGTTLPTLAARGASNQYRAWSFLNGIDSDIVLDLGTLSDSVRPTQLVSLANRYTIALAMTSLGAGTGSSKWTVTMYDASGVPPVYAASAITTTYPGVNYLFGHTATDERGGAVTADPYIDFIDGPGLTTQPWMLVVQRNGASGIDTFAGSAGLIGIKVSYTADM